MSSTPTLDHAPPAPCRKCTIPLTDGDNLVCSPCFDELVEQVADAASDVVVDLFDGWGRVMTAPERTLVRDLVQMVSYDLAGEVA